MKRGIAFAVVLIVIFLLGILATIKVGTSNVEISGEVSSANYWPLGVQFENYACLARPQVLSRCVFSANITYLGGSLGNSSTYWTTAFSATLPNNQNYSVTVIMGTEGNAYHASSTLYGNNATISAGFLPLFNKTDKNSSFFIQCISTGLNYTSSPIACHISWLLGSC